MTFKRVVMLGMSLLFGAASLLSCSGDEISDVVVEATLSSRKLRDGEKLVIDVHAFTVNDAIKSLTLSSFDTENGDVDLWAVYPDEKDYKGSYIYTAPRFGVDSVGVKLRFTATDNLGNVQRFSYQISVLWADRPLEEYAGNTICSAPAQENNAFSLSSCQVFSYGEDDQDRVDIYVDKDGNWRSMTGALFSKIKGFDYAGATASSLYATVQSMSREGSVSSPKADDVLLITRTVSTEGTTVYTPWGAVKIVAVYPGDEFVRYIFSYKKI